MRRKTKPPLDDYPMPWEDSPVTRERWQKHRARMMAACHEGRRPIEWWLYELGRWPPENQTQTLYTMGVLRAEEIAKLMKFWRIAYEDTNKRTPEQRQKYLDFHSVPHELVAQWDAERVIKLRPETGAA